MKICILLSPVLQQFFRAHAGPHLLDIHGFYQPLQDLVFQRHSVQLLLAAAISPAGS